MPYSLPRQLKPPLQVSNRFNYLVWDDKYLSEKPYVIVSSLSRPGIGSGPFEYQPPSVPYTNCVVRPHDREELVQDVRGQESHFQLDSHGFVFRKGPPRSTTAAGNFEAFYDAKRVNKEYIPEVVVPWLKGTIPNVERIVVFEWNLRKNDPESMPEYQDLLDPTQPALPSDNVHIDQSPAGAIRRVRENAPAAEVERYLKRRVRIINLWKPLFNPVLDSPLAVCDGSTVTPRDCVHNDIVRRDRLGESVFVLPSTRLRWYYLSSQGPDEVLLMKQFDSDKKCPAKCCPHSAFTLPFTPPEAPPRESIEIRALVFSD